MNDETDAGRPDPLDGAAETLDRAAYAMVAQATHGLSPATLAQAYFDWAMHLAASPGKQVQLAAKAGRKNLRLLDYLLHSATQGANAEGCDACKPAITPLPQDHRFNNPMWSHWPYNLYSQAFLLNQQWWHAATSGVMGVGKHHEAMVSFAARQLLDTLAPTNFIATNPELQKRIVDTNGQCLIDGAALWFEDFERSARGEPPVGAENFTIGKDLAATPGKVVYRNELIELIQYTPTTDTVRPEPVLIVPAWIMKYYILDLSAHNSLIGWLVGQGYTVFAISWHNPTGEDRDENMEDYRRKGPVAAIDAITAITGAEKIHALGYCLGGTLLSIAAAAMARDGDKRLASVTLLAAQTEFSEPGELSLFIDEGQLNLLENMMWSRGYLDSSEMGGAFQMLRSNDLIWSHMLRTYLMGERDPMNDLMAWNADGTRMPYAMHSQYLRRLFLEDALAEGHYKVEGRAISLSSIRVPMFVVGTETDHVAPWHSVHKIHWLTGAEITFVLTSGGHNAGIVSEPGHPHRHYHMLKRPLDGPALSPEEWTEQAPDHPGSWWVAWKEWLDAHSGDPVAPPAMGAPDKGYAAICDAPGRYVLEH